MVHIDTLALGSYQTNCHIVSSEESRCIIIDPGSNAPFKVDFQTSWIDYVGAHHDAPAGDS